MKEALNRTQVAPTVVYVPQPPEIQLPTIKPGVVIGAIIGGVVGGPVGAVVGASIGELL